MPRGQNRKLGNMVKAARKARGLSQAELARRTGLAQETICRLERGFAPTVATLSLIADELGVSLRFGGKKVLT